MAKKAVCVQLPLMTIAKLKLLAEMHNVSQAWILEALIEKALPEG